MISSKISKTTLPLLLGLVFCLLSGQFVQAYLLRDADFAGPLIEYVGIDQIVIDGHADDWEGIGSILIGNSCDGCELPDASDLYGKARIAWDDFHLFLLIDVLDDEVDVDGSRKIFDLDGVEVLIDGYHDRTKPLGADDLHLLITADGRWRVRTSAPTRYSPEVVAVQRSYGYRLEVSIPWELIGGIGGAFGQKHGFNLVLNDRDSETRDGQLFWKYAGEHWRDSQLFGVIGLGPVQDDVLAPYGSRTLDGLADDWGGIPRYALRDTCPNCVLPEAPDVASALSMSWDESYLYLLVEVVDDQIVLDGRKDVVLWDSIALLFDGLEDRSVEFDRDDHQIFIAADGLLDLPPSRASNGQVIVKASANDEGYILEAAFSWDYLQGKAPILGESYGFTLIVNDRDSQEQAREQLYWHFPEFLLESTEDYSRVILK